MSKNKKYNIIMRKLRNFLAGAAVILAAATLGSCGKDSFHVEGTVTNAKDSILYFEHNGLDGFSVLDSTKLICFAFIIFSWFLVDD